jgi:bifunctional enzyme CysN/CysC
MPLTGRATVSELKHRVDAETFTPIAAKMLSLNEIGFCNLSLGRTML